MTEARWWRWAGLALIGIVAALFASFNGGERVALNFGFTILYRVPLVTLIFVAFLAGMTTMFLLGLRHDLRVRRALREAGFGEPIAAEEGAPDWGDAADERRQDFAAEAPSDPPSGPPSAEGHGSTELFRRPAPDSEPPPRDPP